jgi:hypothetical protein
MVCKRHRPTAGALLERRFPACPSVIECSGTNGEAASFARRGATNLFTVSLPAQGKTFQAPLSSAGVTVTLSLGGEDQCGDAYRCRVSGYHKQIAR